MKQQRYIIPTAWLVVKYSQNSLVLPNVIINRHTKKQQVSSICCAHPIQPHATHQFSLDTFVKETSVYICEVKWLSESESIEIQGKVWKSLHYVSHNISIENKTLVYTFLLAIAIEICLLTHTNINKLKNCNRYQIMKSRRWIHIDTHTYVCEYTYACICMHVYAYTHVYAKMNHLTDVY